MKPLLHAIVSLCIGTLDVWAEDKAPAEKPLIGISLTSFNDIITDPVKITERVAFKGKTANSFDEVQHADLRLSRIGHEIGLLPDRHFNKFSAKE